MGELKSKEAHDGFRLQFSQSENYLLTGRKIWNVESRQLLWECPEPSHASGVGHSYRAAHLFDDERHILIQQDAQYQIWAWEKNKKRATILLLPNRYWAFFNHETGHYTESVLAFQSLRFQHMDQAGKQVWLSRSQYEKQTGWKNDPSRAGLSDLAKSGSGK